MPPPPLTRVSTRRILLYGDFQHDRLAASYERAFKALGHTVARFNTRDIHLYLAPWLRYRLPARLTRTSAHARAIGARAWNDRLLATAHDQRPDLLFITNGDLITPRTLHRIRHSVCPVFIFHADNPFPPYAGHHPETIPSALACDCYFTWSRSLQLRLRNLGVSRVEYLPFAWDPEVFPAQQAGASPHEGVTFIGGWDRLRESTLEEISRHVPLRIYGPSYWRTRTRTGSPLRSAWQGSALGGAAAAQVLASSAVAMNILRQQNQPDGTNMRTFELAGVGACALSTRTAGATEIFPENEAAFYFSDLSECVAQIERLLPDATLRQRAVTNARRIVRQGQLYDDRARSVLAVLDSTTLTQHP